MIPYLYYWILALCLSGLAALVLKADRRVYARKVFVFIVSVFVAQSLVWVAGKQEQQGRVTPVLDADRAELLLRFNLSLEAMESAFVGSVAPIAGQGNQLLGHQAPVPLMKGKEFDQEAYKILKDTVAKNGDVPLLRARLAILIAEQNLPAKSGMLASLISQVTGAKDAKTQELGRALQSMYLTEHIRASDVPSIKATLQSLLPNGWFRDKSLLRLYKEAGLGNDYKNLFATVQEKALHLFINCGIVLFAFALIALIGAIVIIVQLALFARTKIPPPPDNGLSKISYGTIYVVFIFWLATQVLVSSFAQTLIKPINLATTTALTAACVTACIYLLENAPALIYINWIAFRPQSIGFVDGIRLYFRKANAGPLKLVLTGFAAWCAAVPIVIVAFLIASSFLGSQGSTNPIIALVLEASRSSNHLAAGIFYLTLGFFAPICEEPLFRGFLYGTLRQKTSIGPALFISAFAFAALHLDPGGMLPLFCLGLIFGYTFERTGSVVPSMVAHGLWNSATFTLLLLIFGW